MRFHERGSRDVRTVGELFDYVSITPPGPWALYADGALTSKTVFPELWSKCGIQFGADTPTHFRIPDCRERGRMGYLAADPDFGIIGGTGGTRTHTHANHVMTQPNNHAAQAHAGGAVGSHQLTAAESGLPAHTHIFLLSGAGGAGSLVGGASGDGVPVTPAPTFAAVSTNAAANAAAAHPHSFTQPNDHPALAHVGAAVDAHDTPQHLNQFITLPVMIVALP